MWLPSHIYRTTLSMSQKKKVKAKFCYRNYIELITLLVYISLNYLKVRVFDTKYLTHLSLLTESSAIQKWLFITPKPFLSYFWEIFKMMRTAYQNSPFQLCYVEKCGGSIMIFYKANNIRAFYIIHWVHNIPSQLRKSNILRRCHELNEWMTDKPNKIWSLETQHI